MDPSYKTCGICIIGGGARVGGETRKWRRKRLESLKTGSGSAPPHPAQSGGGFRTSVRPIARVGHEHNAVRVWLVLSTNLAVEAIDCLALVLIVVGASAQGNSD